MRASDGCRGLAATDTRIKAELSHRPTVDLILSRQRRRISLNSHMRIRTRHYYLIHQSTSLLPSRSLRLQLTETAPDSHLPKSLGHENCVGALTTASIRRAPRAIANMPLTETELTLVETMFMNQHSVKDVLHVLPHAVVSTLYRQKKTFDTYGSIHNPGTTSKRRLRKPVVADAEAHASPVKSESPQPKDSLSESERTVEMLFSQGYSVRVVQTWFPNKPKSSLYRMQKNFLAYGSVRKPEVMYKKKGRPSAITPEMKEYLIELIKDGKEMWQRDLAYELFTKFGVFVSASTISRLLKEQNIVKRLGPVENVDTDMASDEDEDDEDEHMPVTNPNLDPLLRWA